MQQRILEMAADAQNVVKNRTDGLVISDYVHPHAVNAGVPVEEIKPPLVGKNFEVDEAVIDGQSLIQLYPLCKVC